MHQGFTLKLSMQAYGMCAAAGPQGMPGFHPDDFTPGQSRQDAWNDLGPPPGMGGLFPRRAGGPGLGGPGFGGGGMFG